MELGKNKRWSHTKPLFYLPIHSLGKCSGMVFFFQYNLAIQLLTCNSAFLITKTTFHKSQQEPGYFTGLVNAQPLLIAPCKQMPGPCWSPLSKAHGGLPTCDTAINGGTWTSLNINGFVTLVSGFHRISGHVTSAESQATFRHYWKSSLKAVDVVGSNDEPTGGFGGGTTNLRKKKKRFWLYASWIRTF